jgi:hypothetical protein
MPSGVGGCSAEATSETKWLGRSTPTWLGISSRLQTKIIGQGPHDDHCPLAHVLDKREAEGRAALCEAARESDQFRGAMETINALP